MNDNKPEDIVSIGLKGPNNFGVTAVDCNGNQIPVNGSFGTCYVFRNVAQVVRVGVPVDSVRVEPSGGCDAKIVDRTEGKILLSEAKTDCVRLVVASSE
jgi:hypothetical protein